MEGEKSEKDEMEQLRSDVSMWRVRALQAEKELAKFCGLQVAAEALGLSMTNLIKDLMDAREKISQLEKKEPPLWMSLFMTVGFLVTAWAGFWVVGKVFWWAVNTSWGLYLFRTFINVVLVMGAIGGVLFAVMIIAMAAG